MRRVIDEKLEIGKEEEDREGRERGETFMFSVPPKKKVIGMKRSQKLLELCIQQPLLHTDEYLNNNLELGVGIMLYGPPGLGKTYLCEAVAAEFGIKFCLALPSSIKHKHLGESSKNVKRLMDAAVDNMPCIVFLDEFDALFADRNSSPNDGAEEQDIKAEFLARTGEVLGRKENKLFIVGATNRPWALDKAFIRSGRIEIHIYIEAPNLKDRVELFRFYCNHAHLNYYYLGLISIYYSPADIKKICRVAQRNAIARTGKAMLTTRNITKALRSKEGGKSSLDAWYWNAHDKLLGEHHSLIKKVLRGLVNIGLRRKRDGEQRKKGELTESERMIYAEMIKDVKKFSRNYAFIRLIRCLRYVI